MTLPIRTEVETKYKWSLEDFYPTLKEWEKEFGQGENQIADIEGFKGRLGEGALTVRLAIETYLTNLRRVERLYTYAHMKSDEDTADSESLSLLDRAGGLFSRFAASASFLLPEMLDLPDELTQGYLGDGVLEPYRRMLTEILRFRPHTLSKEEENILALGSEVFGGADKIFSQLNNADFTFGVLKINGEDKLLTHGTFITFLKNPDPKIRKDAFEQYYKVYESHQNSLVSIYGTSLKTDCFLAKAKKYSSALEKSLFPDQVTTDVYTGLVKSASSSLSALHEYYQFRKDRLKLSEITLADTHVPLVGDVKTHYPYEQAIDTLLEAFQPLGKDYVSILEKGVRAERWVDVYETKSKRSGAYCSGCFDSKPYVLMNYKEDSLSDLFTLAHELGHAMHAELTNRNQAYQDHQFGIFVAEVASTFNEQLLLAHLRKVYANNSQMLAFLLNHQLDEIKAMFYRQTMFAEFEMLTHEMVERHEAVTTDSLKESYTALLKKYFGPAVSIKENNWVECLRIPHFYSAFYVYKYATGLAASLALSNSVLTGVSGAKEKYLKFLSSGAIKPPLDLLEDAGVNMRDGKATATVAEIFASRLRELKSVIGN
jgi:oligoendopeptidase F